MKKGVLFMVLLFLTGCSYCAMQTGNAPERATSESAEASHSETDTPSESNHTPYEEVDMSSIIVDETDADYIFLRDYVEFFTYGPIGEAAVMPDGLEAFGRIFAKENALDYFYKLESEAENEGKLYALCGLYYLDYANYPYLMEKYGSSVEVVTYMAGCEIMKRRIEELIKIGDEADLPVVRLIDNEDTYDAWRERNPSVASYMLDFFGGGIPDSVRYMLSLSWTSTKASTA